MKRRKKITKMRLYHFQAHVDTTLYFDPVSTAIVGATDVGKSTITRALYWVLYNKPARIGHPGTPDEFTTWGERHCFVTVTFDDGTEITRGRKDGENYYNLVNSDGVKTPFKGFGFSVPQAITDAHGMYPLIIDDKEISLNITQQHDGIFMLEDGASLRAKAVGKLSGADKADGAIGVVNTWHRTASNDRKSAIEEISSLNDLIEDYAFVDDLDEAINITTWLLSKVSVREDLAVSLTKEYQALLHVENQKKVIMSLMAYEASVITLDQLINTLSTLSSKMGIIDTVVSRFLAAEQERELLDLILAEADNLRDIDLHISTAKLSTDRYITLLSDLQKYNNIEAELGGLVKMLSQAHNVDTVDNLLTELSTAVGSYSAILSSHIELANLQRRIARGVTYIEKLEGDLQNIVDEYVNVLQSASVCPFCYSDITEEQLAKISV